MTFHAAAGWMIRRHNFGDTERCSQIFLSCLKDFPWRGKPEPYLATLKHALWSERAFVAVEPHAGVVGFLTLQMSKAYVDHLFVAPDWRLCGIGSGLLATARKEAGQSLMLDVDKRNIAAQAAYKKMGWHHVAALQGRGGTDQIRMFSR